MGMVNPSEAKSRCRRYKACSSNTHCIKRNAEEHWRIDNAPLPDVRFSFKENDCILAGYMADWHLIDPLTKQAHRQDSEFTESNQTRIGKITPIGMRHGAEAAESIQEYNRVHELMKEDLEDKIDCDSNYSGECKADKHVSDWDRDLEILRHSVLLQGSIVTKRRQLAAYQVLGPNKCLYTAEPITESVTIPLGQLSCHGYERANSEARIADDSIEYLHFFMQPDYSLLGLDGNFVTKMVNDAFQPASPSRYRRNTYGVAKTTDVTGNEDLGVIHRIRGPGYNGRLARERQVTSVRLNGPPPTEGHGPRQEQI